MHNDWLLLFLFLQTKLVISQTLQKNFNNILDWCDVAQEKKTE